MLMPGPVRLASSSPLALGKLVQLVTLALMKGGQWQLPVTVELRMGCVQLRVCGGGRCRKEPYI
jgi:hypothetical protein